jgi:hypothetical protein
MAAGIISSERPRDRAKNITTDSFTGNITSACAHSKNSTLGNTVAVIIYATIAKARRLMIPVASVRGAPQSESRPRFSPRR